MAIYNEKVIDKKTGQKVDKTINGKKQYYIRVYINENGRKKQITRHNKKWLGRDGDWEAEQEERRLKFSGIDDETKSKYKREKITLNELKEMYINSLLGRLDDESLEAKINRLNHFCNFDNSGQVKTYPKKYITEFDKKIYTQWQNQMKEKTYICGNKQKKYSIEYLNRINNEIINMIDFAVDNGLCQLNFAKQCGKIGTPKEIKISQSSKSYVVLDRNEYEELLKVSSENLKYNTFFDLTFTRGPRIGEIRAFQVKDYNYDTKQLMVNHTLSKKNKLKPPKTASSKAPINLDKDVAKKVEKLIENLKEQEGFNEEWFIFNGPSPISENALRHARDKYFRKAGITKHVRIHDLRHSCATWMYSVGIPITVISKILRHANIKETMKTYTHLFEQDYAKELSKIDSFRKEN